MLLTCCGSVETPAEPSEHITPLEISDTAHLHTRFAIAPYTDCKSYYIKQTPEKLSFSLSKAQNEIYFDRHSAFYTLSEEVVVSVGSVDRLSNTIVSIISEHPKSSLKTSSNTEANYPYEFSLYEVTPNPRGENKRRTIVSFDLMPCN